MKSLKINRRQIYKTIPLLIYCIFNRIVSFISVLSRNTNFTIILQTKAIHMLLSIIIILICSIVLPKKQKEKKREIFGTAKKKQH